MGLRVSVRLCVLWVAIFALRPVEYEILLILCYHTAAVAVATTFMSLSFMLNKASRIANTAKCQLAI